jgi:hypothetical protein
MQTSTYLALQPAVTARPLTPFEQTLAGGALKRVEATRLGSSYTRPSRASWPPRGISC